MKHLCSAVALVLLAAPLAAQGAETAPQLSTYLDMVKSIGTSPTVASVAAAKAAADIAMKQGCSVAVPALEAYADQSNHLSNLLDQSLEPFNRSVGDAQYRIRATMGTELAPAIQMVSELRSGRDEAWVQIAECYFETDKPLDATAQLYMALDIMDGTNAPLYRRARDLLWRIVGFNSDH